MLDIKLIRERPDIVRKNLERRGDVEKLKMLDELIEYDKKWRRSLTELNRLRHKRKVVTVDIANLKKKGKDASEKLEEATKILENVEKLEKNVKEYKEKIDYVLRGFLTFCMSPFLSVKMIVKMLW